MILSFIAFQQWSIDKYAINSEYLYYSIFGPSNVHVRLNHKQNLCRKSHIQIHIH